MTRVQTHAEDCVELAREYYRRGEVDRRTFLAACALFGAAPLALAGRPAHAQAKPITIIGWGGDESRCTDEAYQKPYEMETGTKFRVDTSGPTAGKLRAIAESGNVFWDCASSVPHTGFQLGQLGYLDEIDYSIVDKKKVLPGFTYQHSVAYSTFSDVLAYDTAKFKDRKPRTWADFWNLKEFPGKRTLWKGFNGVLEAALMADGVPMDKIYPIDVDRAFKKIREIKKDTVFWNSGSESQNLIRDGEVAMAWMWSTRANGVRRDTRGRVDYTFNQGLLVPGVWIVAKANPAGKEVYRFIESTMKPERQVEMLKCYGYGPANPAASAMVPPEYQAIDPLNPDNRKLQLQISSEWYRDKLDTVYPKYVDLISS